LNYWKLRGSLASTARSSAPYANQAILNFNTGSGACYYYDFTNANPELVPERQKTFEIGSEFKFKGNRLSAEITYYKTQNKNLIAENFRASYGTGFVLNTINVGANENSGIEMVLDYQVINKKDFTWNTRLNFNRMRNKVTELPSSVPEFYISDTWLYGNARGGLTLGNPTTTITSYGYQRNTAGKVLIDPATGLPLVDPNFKVRGDRNPNFTLGWINNITYKDLKYFRRKIIDDLINLRNDINSYIKKNIKKYNFIYEFSHDIIFKHYNKNFNIEYIQKILKIYKINDILNLINMHLNIKTNHYEITDIYNSTIPINIIDRWKYIIKLSSHVARNTFVYILLKENVDIFSISNALAHSEIKTTQNYIKSGIDIEASDNAGLVINRLI
jgi:hypothetical protein